MDRQRVLILCAQPLFGEGIQHILGEETAVEVVGMEPLELKSLDVVGKLRPDVVVITEGVHSPQAAAVTGELLQAYAEVPLIRVDLEENRVQIYRSRLLPASAGDLKDALKRLRGDE